MKKALILFFLLINSVWPLNGQKYDLTLLPVDVVSSFRGLSVVDDRVAWVSGTGGTVGRTIDGGKEWLFTAVKGFEKTDFRTLYAFNELEAVIANAGSPSYILRTDDGGATWVVVYENTDPLVFFDGADFWNKYNGLIYGDPLGGRMFVMKTTDGGHTWIELAYESRPSVSDGEASFAASGTGIRCYDRNRAVMVTGGEVSRLLISDDRGDSWLSILLPVIQGSATTGAFSVAFRSKKQAVIVGGDYTKENLTGDHVFYTNNAGKDWQAPALSTGGFRECVIFLDKKTLMTVGPGGSDFSTDAGRSWQPLSGEKGLHVAARARRGSLVLAAGNRKIAVISTIE